MIIKKLSATFGKLGKETLELESGLNIVKGSNEAGKSTWCAFVRAMLYGVNSTERDKDDHLADKTRFRPWDGSAMEGSMDIQVSGRDITLQRLSKGQNGAMKQFSAVYTGTAEPVQALLGADAGEMLTGVSEKVYERSAFIRQAGVAVGQTAELEKRVAAIVSSGEEDVSFSDADKLLNKWLRKRRYNSSGLLPKLDERLGEIDAKLKYMDDTGAQYAELKADIEKFDELRKEFKEQAELYARKERADGRALLAEADEKQRALSDEIAALKAKLSASGSIPERGEAEKGRELAAKHKAAADMAESASERAAAKATELQNARDKLASSMFANKCAEEARAEVNGLADMENARMRSVLARRIIAAVLAVCAAVAFFVLADTTVLKIVCAAVFVLACAGAIPGKKRSAELSKFGVKSVSELQAKLAEHETSVALLKQSEKAAEAAEAEAEQAYSEKLRSGEELINQAKLFRPKVKTAEEAADALEKASGDYASLESLIPHCEAAQRFYEALAAKDYGKDVERPESVPKPKYSKAEVASGLKYAEKELAAAKTAFAVAQGEIKSMGDPAILATEREKLVEERVGLSEEYEALTMAIDTLREADAEIQARFAPMLSERAGEILETLTGGKYETLTFSKNLAAFAGEKGDAVTHSALYLSGGTLDQIYLALRLAICELALPEENPCPIVLDDALASFDDERMAAALEVLREQSKKRQIIVFTCHSREAQYFAKDKSVNIVELKNAR